VGDWCDLSDTGTGSALSSAKKRPVTLKREVRSLLNKISPENEIQILPQMMALPIRSAEDLNLISTLIVDKALGDPFYSEVYVRCIERLCQEHMVFPDAPKTGELDLLLAAGGEAGSTSSKEIQSAGDGGKASATTSFGLDEEFQGHGVFKGLVLQCCSRVFFHFFGSADFLNDDIQALQSDGKEGGSDDEATLAEAAMKKRHRARACMRFLGHLFVHGIILESMLQTFLNRLLEAPKECDVSRPPKAWIECACELLYTVGKELTATVPGKATLKNMIRTLGDWKDLRADADAPTLYSEVAKGKGANFVYPLRTRFMIQDTVEAHMKGWPAATTEKGVPERATCVSPTTRDPKPNGKRSQWPF
jgi:hypothetical protein